MIAELEAQIIAALQTLFDRFGWLGVAGLMAFENATGITPSEIILGLAGWLLLAAKDAGFGMVFVGALYAALGSTAGASVTYWLVRLAGDQWLTVWHAGCASIRVTSRVPRPSFGAGDPAWCSLGASYQVCERG